MKATTISKVLVLCATLAAAAAAAVPASAADAAPTQPPVAARPAPPALALAAHPRTARPAHRQLRRLAASANGWFVYTPATRCGINASQATVGPNTYVGLNTTAAFDYQYVYWIPLIAAYFPNYGWVTSQGPTLHLLTSLGGWVGEGTQASLWADQNNATNFSTFTFNITSPNGYRASSVYIYNYYYVYDYNRQQWYTDSDGWLQAC